MIKASTIKVVNKFPSGAKTDNIFSKMRLGSNDLIYKITKGYVDYKFVKLPRSPKPCKMERLQVYMKEIYLKMLN